MTSPIQSGTTTPVSHDGKAEEADAPIERAGTPPPAVSTSPVQGRKSHTIPPLADALEQVSEADLTSATFAARYEHLIAGEIAKIDSAQNYFSMNERDAWEQSTQDIFDPKKWDNDTERTFAFFTTFGELPSQMIDRVIAANRD